MANQNKKDQKNQNSIKGSDVEENEIEVDENGEAEEFEEFMKDEIGYDDGIWVDLEVEDLEALDEIEKVKAIKQKHRNALKKLRVEIDDLSPNGLNMVRLIGLKNYLKLVYVYGGTSIYLPQHEKLVERKRRSYVYNVYLELNSDLKKTITIFGLSESTVRKYVADERKYQNNKRLKNRKKQN